METLSLSSRCLPVGFLRQKGVSSSGCWIRLLKDPKLIGSGLGRISLNRKILSVQSFPLFSSSLPLVEEVAKDNDISIAETKSENGSVHVKFVLQKPCLLGEKFLIVGDDPMFGLWDLEKAVPLNWSDDHFWTAEMDLPIGKSLRFKFILQTCSGEFHWQPGPDRVLQTWETANTIVVTEDWENATEQKIQEQLSSTDNEVISSELRVAASNEGDMVASVFPNESANAKPDVLFSFENDG